MERSLADEESGLQYYFLDMGSEKYGDCVLVVAPDATVLIDGGHSADYAGQPGYGSIPDQIAEILQTEPPFDISLLVVTHCHTDHTGCLPKMIAQGDLSVKWALVADDAIGFGRTDTGGSDSLERAPDRVKRLVAALREERHDGLTGEKLERFLSDAQSAEQRYQEMLATLEQQGTTVIKYTSPESAAPVVEAFSSIGLAVLGPSKEQLGICAEAIKQFTDEAASTLTDALSSDAAQSDAALYRRIVRSGGISDAADRAGKGAAVNDTSIVLSLGSGDDKVLLAGDMQFAKPELSGADQLMAQLLERVNQNGPYRLIKLAHHTSYNGLDASVLAGWKGTPFFVHTGGRNDTGHPEPNALALLKKNHSWLKYARTDRNGMVTLDPERGLVVTRGRLNDFTPNRGRSDAEPAEAFGLRAAMPSGSSLRARFTVPVPWHDDPITVEYEVRGDAAGGFDERVSSSASGVGAAGGDHPRRVVPRPPSGSGAKRLAGGRNLPSLLFVTASKTLTANIGVKECETALAMIRDAGQQLLDLDGPDGAKRVQQKLAEYKKCSGVVILGGYDVVRPQKLDVLTPEMRAALGYQVGNDNDQFIIWSDGIYGDVDGDGLAELPVSRIPDGRSARLVLAALAASKASQSTGASQRFGIRNNERPFADLVWNTISGDGDLLLSGPSTTADVSPNAVNARNVYFMLHGSDFDGARFWGGDGEEAMNVARVPSALNGHAFAGCCWGALISQHSALNSNGDTIAPKTVESSIALRILAAGGLAFVGCTGVHYSPDESGTYFGGPMHMAFWDNIRKGLSPAAALHQARIDYVAGMPHGRRTMWEQAIERKILMQFTCLGLGW